MLTRPTSKELKDEVEDIAEVIGSRGFLSRGIVAVAVLGRHPLPVRALADRVQVGGYLRNLQRISVADRPTRWRGDIRGGDIVRRRNQ